MITITNLDVGNKNGQAKYRVMINDKFICEFWHKPTDGLERCLLEASKEVERQKWEDTKLTMTTVATGNNFTVAKYIKQ